MEIARVRIITEQKITAFYGLWSIRYVKSLMLKDSSVKLGSVSFLFRNDKIGVQRIK